MTPEQRIAQLEADLAEERAERRRLSETLRVMVETQARERAAEAERKAVRSARNTRARSKASTETSHETRAETSQSPAPSSSPPLSFSLPPPSAPSPSILYPFSPASPPPPPAASQATATAAPPPLTLTAQEPEKPKRAPNTGALGEFVDWARAETKPRLPADAVDPAAGMKQHERVRLGEAVKLHGLEALKAAFRLFMGWQVAQEKGYSVGFFSAQWETWVRQVKAGGATAAPAEDEKSRLRREAWEKMQREKAQKAAGGGP